MQKNFSVLVLCFIFCLSEGCFAVGFPGRAASETTTINFPVQSMGRLDIVQVEDSPRRVKAVGRGLAQGKVALPANCKLNLRLSYFGGQNTDLLKKIPGDRLNRVDCNTVEMDHKNLIQLGQLKKLEELNVEKTNLTDDEARQLGGLTELKELILNDTELTPAGLSVINNFKKLETLKVSSINVGGLSTINFNNLSSLKTLDLCQTKLISKDIQKLENMHKLLSLNLGKNDINDSGIDSILKLKSLRYLILVDDKVTAKGLCRLAKLPDLKMVFIRKSKYTPAELLEAQKLMPKVTFMNDFRETKMDLTLFAPLK